MAKAGQQSGQCERWKEELGSDLRSQEAALQVPSALAGLTAGFEMGPGVPPPLTSPRKALPLSHVCVLTRARQASPPRSGCDTLTNAGRRRSACCFSLATPCHAHAEHQVLRRTVVNGEALDH